MSDNSYGVTLYDAKDVLPLGLVGTPWEIVFKSLRDVLKSDVDASDSGFMCKACALYFLARGDLEAVTDRDVLNGIAAALAIPYWVENFDDPTQASAILYHWLKYKPTRANLTALALASGMRAFKLREIYTSTEYGLSHSFGFDLGEGYDTSFFAGPDAEPGLATAQRICGALTHFFLRIKDSPTLITDVTYPDAPPSGWQYFFRPDQSQIRILQAVRWDLFDAEGNLAFSPDEYAVISPVAVRDKFGVNTAVSALSEILILDSGQLKLVWGQAPTDAYCLYALVTINIPGMVPAWPSLSHADVNIPPNTIPGLALYMTDGTQVTGSNWSIFAAYDSDLNRIDSSDLYLVGTSPVRLRSRRYVRLCQVWLVPPFVAGGTVSSNSEHIIYSMAMTGLLVPGGYAYQDGDLLDMQWDFGGVVEEYVVPSQPAIGGVMTATTDSKFYGEFGGVLELDILMPTVSLNNDFGQYNWLYVDTSSTYKTISANSIEQVLLSGSAVTYDSSNSYGVQLLQPYKNGAAGDATRVSVVSYNQAIGIKNIYSSSIDVYGVRVAVCSSNQATIVTVYSSSNEAFNAFKFSLNGVDYYYVLEGTQTDWTDDLESIGYHAYF